MTEGGEHAAAAAAAAASGSGGSWRSGGLLTHSATGAARLARQASHRADATHCTGSTAAGAADADASLRQQVADARAQLAAALATARRVLCELALGGAPAESVAAAQHAAGVAELESQLVGLGLDELMAELVYEVQRQLGAAAQAAAAADAAATATAAGSRPAAGAAAEAGAHARQLAASEAARQELLQRVQSAAAAHEELAMQVGAPGAA